MLANSPNRLEQRSEKAMPLTLSIQVADSHVSIGDIPAL
jgi:hypothetical protein